MYHQPREIAQMSVNTRFAERVQEELDKRLEYPVIGELTTQNDVIEASVKLSRYIYQHNKMSQDIRSELKPEHAQMMIDAGFKRCTDSKGWVFDPS